MCLTIHDTRKIGADKRINVSMGMMYVELVNVRPL